MRTIETKLYTIDEHPNTDLCFDYIRENIFDLNEHSLMDALESIKMLTEFIGGKNDYSISQFPCRGEYVIFNEYDEELLMELDADELPLTGVYFDAHLIESMQRYGNADGLLHALHTDTEYTYSDEGLREIAEINEWEFTEEGKLF
jgi:hypothetical protein